MTQRNLLSISDFSAKEIEGLLRTAGQMKKKPSMAARALEGKTIALVFEKPSTRTLVSFAGGIQSMSGFPLVLQHDALQWKRGETIADMARVMTRYVHGVMIRACKHTDVAEFIQHMTVPVINGLTDEEHPCQVLSDLLTLWERNGKSMAGLRKLKIVFLGDSNNVSNSWLYAAGLLGLQFVLACPAGYDPDSHVMVKARKLALQGGGRITVLHDPQVASLGADVLYTDVWTSMGQESEEPQRLKAFKPFQLNLALVKRAKSTVVILHCLPAKRGEEITNDVMEGPNSIVFDQAENRLHMQKAIMLKLLS